jgi:hypothetical protein
MTMHVWLATRLSGARHLSRGWWSFVACALLVALPKSGVGQTMNPTEVREINNDLANNAVAAIEIFSAGKMVAAGTFVYDNPSSPDVEFSTLKLPLSHRFGSESNSVRPFFEGYLGYFDMAQRLSDANASWGSYEVQSGTITLGGGAELDLNDWLMLVPRLQFAYSHVEMRLEGNPPPPYDTLLTAWRADALGVIPSLELRAHRRWGRWDVLASSHYSYIRVLGIDDTSALIKLDSETHVWRNEVSAHFHSPWKTFGLPLEFAGLFARHDLAGQIRQSDFVAHFYEIRGTVFGLLPRKIGPIEQVSFSGAYYFNGPFTGYSIGLSLGF